MLSSIQRTSLITKSVASRLTVGLSRSARQQHLWLKRSISHEVSKHMTMLKIDPELHKDIVKALEPVYGKEVSVAHLESFGAEGMKALAEAVQQERQRTDASLGRSRPKKTIKIRIPHHNTDMEVTWRYGQSLLELAEQESELLGEYIEGTCGGQMSCCTCHVRLDTTTFETLDPPTEAELDMLDLAYEPSDTSRLGCQVRLIDSLLKLDEITVTLPSGINNVWT